MVVLRVNIYIDSIVNAGSNPIEGVAVIVHSVTAIDRTVLVESASGQMMFLEGHRLVHSGAYLACSFVPNRPRA